MIYPVYPPCFALMLPVFALTAFIVTIMLLAACPSKGWSILFSIPAYFGAGIRRSAPLWLAHRRFLRRARLPLGAGAIPALRIHVFHGLATLAALCVVFCLYAASTEDRYNVFNALLVLSPSLVGIAACFWCAAKFKGIR